jgi:hypothetical protein
LVLIAGVDVKLTSSTLDDAVLNSELTLALYAFPALFGGIGVRIACSDSPPG